MRFKSGGMSDPTVSASVLAFWVGTLEMVCKKCEKVRSVLFKLLNLFRLIINIETVQGCSTGPLLVVKLSYKRWLTESRGEQADWSAQDGWKLWLGQSISGVYVVTSRVSIGHTDIESQPYQSKCKDCKQPTTQNKAKYCHGAFYRWFVGNFS